MASLEHNQSCLLSSCWIVSWHPLLPWLHCKLSLHCFKIMFQILHFSPLNSEEYLGVIIAWLSKLFGGTCTEDVCASHWQKPCLFTGDVSCTENAAGHCLATRKGIVWESWGFQTSLGQADGRPWIVGEEEMITNVRFMSEFRKKLYVLLAVMLTKLA